MLEQSATLIKEHKNSILLGLMSVSCASIILSIWKRTRKTNDFGLKKIREIPGIRGNNQHASWLWAIQAFGISTSIVGLGFGGLALGVGHYMNVSSLKEFSLEFKSRIHKKFPSLQVPRNEMDEENATREFLKEWRNDLQNELDQDLEQSSATPTRDKNDPDQDHKKVISSIISDGLGPLGKYTRGGQQK